MFRVAGLGTLGVIKPHFFLFCGSMSRWRYDGDAFWFWFCYGVLFPWRHSMDGRRLVTGVLFFFFQWDRLDETRGDDNDRETSIKVYYCLMLLVLERPFPMQSGRVGKAQCGVCIYLVNLGLFFSSR